MNNVRRLTDQFGLVTTETVKTMFGLFERDFPAAPDCSIEVFRNRMHICSIRAHEAGMSPDVKRAAPQARLKNDDVIYYVKLTPIALRLSGPLTTRDNYTPNYNAEIMVRINNPSNFLQSYFEGLNDPGLDPLARFRRGIEQALQDYAAGLNHDQVQNKGLSSATFKNGRGKKLGIWIEHAEAKIFRDPRRQRIIDIEKQTEIEKVQARSKNEVQNVNSQYALQEEARRREHNRREKSRDTDFDLVDDARRKSYALSQKQHETLISIVTPQVAALIERELGDVETPAELFQKYPQFFRDNPALRQFLAQLPQQPALEPPDRNIPDMFDPYTGQPIRRDRNNSR